MSEPNPFADKANALRSFFANIMSETCFLSSIEISEWLAIALDKFIHDRFLTQALWNVDDFCLLLVDNSYDIEEFQRQLDATGEVSLSGWRLPEKHDAKKKVMLNAILQDEIPHKSLLDVAFVEPIPALAWAKNAYGGDIAFLLTRWNGVFGNYYAPEPTILEQPLILLARLLQMDAWNSAWGHKQNIIELVLSYERHQEATSVSFQKTNEPWDPNHHSHKRQTQKKTDNQGLQEDIIVKPETLPEEEPDLYDLPPGYRELQLWDFDRDRVRFYKQYLEGVEFWPLLTACLFVIPDGDRFFIGNIGFSNLVKTEGEQRLFGESYAAGQQSTILNSLTAGNPVYLLAIEAIKEGRLREITTGDDCFVRGSHFVPWACAQGDKCRVPWEVVLCFQKSVCATLDPKEHVPAVNMTHETYQRGRWLFWKNQKKWTLAEASDLVRGFQPPDDESASYYEPPRPDDELVRYPQQDEEWSHLEKSVERASIILLQARQDLLNDSFCECIHDFSDDRKMRWEELNEFDEHCYCAVFAFRISFEPVNFLKWCRRHNLGIHEELLDLLPDMQIDENLPDPTRIPVLYTLSSSATKIWNRLLVSKQIQTYDDFTTYCHMSRATVSKALDELERHSLVQRERRGVFIAKPYRVLK